MGAKRKQAADNNSTNTPAPKRKKASGNSTDDDHEPPPKVAKPKASTAKRKTNQAQPRKAGGTKRTRSLDENDLDANDNEAEEEPLSAEDQMIADYDLLQLQDPNLRNTQRIAKALGGTRLRRAPAADPATLRANETRLNTLLSNPPLPGRDVRTDGHRQDPDKARWLLRFKDRSEGYSKAKVTQDFNIPFPFAQLPATTPTTVVDRVQQLFGRALNAWPHAMPHIDKKLQPMLVALVLDAVLPDRTIEIVDVRVHAKHYFLDIYYFDPDAGKAATETVRLTPADAYMSGVTVPPLPRVVLVTNRNNKQGIPGSRRVVEAGQAPPYLAEPPDLQGCSTASLHTCQDALRWISMQLTGLIVTQGRFKTLQALYERHLGIKTRKGGYTAGGDLYKVYQATDRSQTVVEPSKSFARDLSCTRSQLVLRVYSMNASRTTPVLDTILQRFASGDDIRRAWIEAAKSADQVNLAIAERVPPSSACDCDDTVAKMELHACESCTKMTICKTRSIDSFGRLVCASCKAHGDSAVTHAVPRAGPQGQAYRSLVTSFKRECGSRGLDHKSDELQKVLEDALQDAFDQIPAGAKLEYTDRYTGMTHEFTHELGSIGNNPSRRRWTPHGLSVDAALLFGDPAHQGMKHAPGNVVVTTNAVNFAKWVFLPAALHIIAEHLHRTDPTSKDVDALHDRLQELRRVMLKQPYNERAANDAPAAAYEKSRAEAVTGKLTVGEEEGPWDDTVHRWVDTIPHPYLREDPSSNYWGAAYEPLQQCAQSIVKYFDVNDKVFRLDDGTIWFGQRSAIPAGLDRNGMWRFCRERLSRMRLECNKKWQTIDNEETLYVEIIFQTCAMLTEKSDLHELKTKYGDRLGIPLSMWWGSPARLSIAHREHGRQMFTGWSQPPTDIAQRLEDDGLNNILIESWTVNSAKRDMAEEYYDKLDDILRSVNVPKQFYDPDAPAPLPSGEIMSFEKLPETTIVDAFDAPGFNHDVLQGNAEELALGEARGAGEAFADVPQDAMNLDNTSSPESMAARLEKLREDIVNYHQQAFIKDPDVARLLVEAHTQAMNGKADKFEWNCKEVEKLVAEYIDEE